MSKAKDISEIISDANFGGTLDVDGTTNLDVVDIDGTVTVGSNTSDLRFNINSANQYPLKFLHAGNTSGHIGGGGSDILRFSNTAGATIMEMNAGQITMPLQPAFMATQVGGTVQSNIANNTTLTFGVERFDNNADFASNTFTAPVTGKYQMQFHGRFHAIDTAASWYRINLVTSNYSYGSMIIDPNFSADLDYYPFHFTYLVDMDASDTATIQFQQSGGTAQTDASEIMFFSGYLVA